MKGLFAALALRMKNIVHGFKTLTTAGIYPSSFDHVRFERRLVLECYFFDCKTTLKCSSNGPQAGVEPKHGSWGKTLDNFWAF